MAKMGASKRTALRFAVYIRGLGGEPLPFAHKDYRAYAAALHRQYNKLRLAFNPTVVKEARAAGRLRIRRQSLVLAAGNSLPGIPSIAHASDDQHNPSHALSLLKTARAQLRRASSMGEVEAENLPKTQRQSAKDAWNCRRKIRHSDYLSAIRHASRLQQQELNIYPRYFFWSGSGPGSLRLRIFRAWMKRSR